jgi:hypothetical protein
MKNACPYLERFKFEKIKIKNCEDFVFSQWFGDGWVNQSKVNLGG